jgi:hypothetical protein
MTDQQFVVQYRVAGFGGKDDLSKRHQIEDLLGQELESADIGFCDGGDIGSGNMNIFLYTHDRRSAEELVIRTLRSHRMLEGAVIAICPNPENDEPYEVVWPEDFDGPFSVL